jgi:3-methylcrotonyl-CoA carboxylase alpha subunit
MRLSCGGDQREVDVRESRQGLQVVVDGAVIAPVVEEIGPGTFLWREGSRSEVFHCVREGDTIHLFWRGSAYRLVEEEETGRAGRRHAPGGLEAPMPGKVIAVKVTAGQAVRKGDELLVVEAMKMENAIRAPRDGTVRAVAAGVGDMVGPGTVLVELE